MKKLLALLLISTSCITLPIVPRCIKDTRKGIVKNRGYYSMFTKMPYTYCDDLAVLSGISLASYGGCMALWKYGRSPHENSAEETRRYTAYKKITACLSLSLGSFGSFLYSMHKTFRHTTGLDADGLPYRIYPEFEGNTELYTKVLHIAGMGIPLCVGSYLVYKEMQERKKASIKQEAA